MANGKIQSFSSLDQSKHHCYTLSTTCTLFKLASEVGSRTNTNCWFQNDCLISKSPNKGQVLFHFTKQMWSLGNSNKIQIFNKVLAFNF